MTTSKAGLTPCAKGRSYAHHWDIATPKGQTWNKALCRYCGKRRLFKAAWPRGGDWDKVREDRLVEEARLRRRKWAGDARSE